MSSFHFMLCKDKFHFLFIFNKSEILVYLVASFYTFPYNGIYESAGYISFISNVNCGFDSYDIACGIVIIN